MINGITLALKENSQSITSNTSNITITATIHWGSGSYNAYGDPLTLKFDGVQVDYDAAVPFNAKAATSGSEAFYTFTGKVTHDYNGEKTLKVRHHGDHISIKLVESAIREAIAAAWNIRIAGVWEQYFPEVRAGVNKRPTNHEFISELSRVLELWTGIRQTHLEKLQRKEVEYAIK